MKHTHINKRLFANDFLKIDRSTKNIEYSNDRANQLNQLEKLVVDKPITIVKPKAIKPTNKPIEEPTIIRQSTRERKPNKDNDYVYD